MHKQVARNFGERSGQFDAVGPAPTITNVIHSCAISGSGFALRGFVRD
jgi:hypothetical protein